MKNKFTVNAPVSMSAASYLLVVLLLLHLPSSTNAVVANNEEECPFITLNFTSIRNPMADVYGQSEFFQGGDYLYDQLWMSHGVKVSARVKVNSHKSNNDPFIPKYKPGVGWVDDKSNQDESDPTSGGAVRLFDTMRPYNHPTRPEFRNPVCKANDVNEGDPDLGSPNERCAIPGPGIGPGGRPLRSNGQPNPYANCNPLGLVAIIQETNKPCPDDTAKGGYITFTFRVPTEVALTSLLDVDEGTTPDITLYYGGGTKKFDTQATGDNGLLPLTFDTSLYQDVTMVDIKYEGSGSIDAIRYRYCQPDIIPEDCVLDTPNPGSEYCPESSGVLPMLVQGTPSTLLDANIIWDVTPVSTSVRPSVSFHVANPFPTSTRLYVQYHKPLASGGSGGGWYQACEEYSLTDCGATTPEPIVADCLSADGNPFTLVELYFVDTTDSLDDIFGPVEIHRCCHAGTVPTTSVAHYSFLLRCSCPTTDGRRDRDRRRRLLQLGSEEDGDGVASTIRDSLLFEKDEETPSFFFDGHLSSEDIEKIVKLFDERE